MDRGSRQSPWGRLEPGRGAAAVGVGAALALALGLALASLIGLLGQTRALQNGAYVVAYGLLLPLGALLVVRALRLEPPAQPADAALSVAGALVAALALMRLATLAGIEGSAVSVFGVLAGLAIAAGAVALTEGRCAPPRRLHRLGAGGRAATFAALGIVTILLFVPDEVGPVGVAGALLAGGAAWRLGRESGGRSVGRRLGLAIDLGLVLLAASLVIDVTGYWGSDFAVSTWSGVGPDQLGPIAQIHQHFYLGPVGDVLAGRTLLVDTNSVYGIANAYVLAGWFQIVPFGYGTFGLFGSLASTVMIVSGWGVMRLAGVGRVIAAIALLLGVMLTVLAPITSPSLFLNVGGFRFGPPLLLLVLAVWVSGREGAVARSAPVLSCFGFFALWSLEALVYCGCAMIALIAADAVATRALRAGMIEVLRGLGATLGAFVAAHLLFAMLTLLVSGELPDWGRYVALFGEWASILEQTFGVPVESFSRAWLVGGLYLASGLGAMLLLLRVGRAGDRLARRRAYAIAGASGIGASFLSYFIAHSSDLFLPYVVFPALIVSALWLALALRGLPATWRGATGAVAAFGAALVLAGSLAETERRLPRTALAHLVPGGPSLEEDLRRMWSSPRIDRRAPAAQELIETHIPGEEAIVLVEPDLGQEALIRTDRANGLPIAYPWQDEVVLEDSLPPVIEAVEGLEPGARVLLQEPPEPGAQPSAALLFEQVFGNVPAGERLGPLTAAAEEEIRRRFELKVVARGPDGLYVAELRPRG